MRTPPLPSFPRHLRWHRCQSCRPDPGPSSPVPATSLSFSAHQANICCYFLLVASHFPCVSFILSLIFSLTLCLFVSLISSPFFLFSVLFPPPFSIPCFPLFCSFSYFTLSASHFLSGRLSHVPAFSLLSPTISISAPFCCPITHFPAPRLTQLRSNFLTGRKEEAQHGPAIVPSSRPRPPPYSPLPQDSSPPLPTCLVPTVPIAEAPASLFRYSSLPSPNCYHFPHRVHQG